MEFSPEIDLIKLKAWKNYMILPLIYFIGVNNINKENFVKWIIICVCLSHAGYGFQFLHYLQVV